MKTLLSLLLLPFLFLPIACSKSKSKPAISKYFYHGDPMEMLSGSTKNKELGFNTSNYNQFEGYSLGIIYLVEEKTEKTSSNSDNAEEGNEATESVDGTIETGSFTFSSLINDKLTYSGSYSDVAVSLSFSAAKNGKLTVDSISIDGETVLTELQHYSESSDKRFFSLLLSGTVDGAAFLATLYFVKDADYNEVKKGDEKYFFTFGKGVMIGWDKSKELEVNLCIPQGKKLQVKGSHVEFNLSVPMDFVAEWQSALGTRLKIKSRERNQYPPFSDLNSRCIYILSSFITDQNPELANYGLTINIPDLSKSQLADSDIFLHASEFDKILASVGRSEQINLYTEIQNVLRKKIEYTISHEFGHMLGLDHVFDGTDSIMAYDRDSSSLSAFDKESIQYLYK